MQTGLDRLLSDPAPLRGRRYGLLAHAASVSAALEPVHLALGAVGYPPEVLFGPEHGFHGVEQDMVATADTTDPWTGARVRSLYGEDASSLRPTPEALDGLDLLIVDLQDVGSRYYTYAATAVWAVEAALDVGCEVWILDRPNPLAGDRVEGNLREAGFDSFVGAFELPVCHGLTLGELCRLELERRGLDGGWKVIGLEGWRRSARWPELGRPWIAPSPNMPSFDTALLYPGLCLVEGTTVSEGRGTTRPFQLVGSPGLDPLGLAGCLEESGLSGVRFVPTYFKPQYQKHAARVCGGVQVVVTDPDHFAPVRTGVEVVVALYSLVGESLWRREAYEFVADRPAIDLLAGSDALRMELERTGSAREWLASWREEERAFEELRSTVLLY